MSEKLTRFKYKSDIVNCIEESWDYYGKDDEKREVREEIEHVYTQAPKVGEYEAKAKAFDAVIEEYEGIMKEVRNRKFKLRSDVTFLGLKVEKVIKKYESGGSYE